MAKQQHPAGPILPHSQCRRVGLRDVHFWSSG
jgi:hypothetical protein